MEAESRVMTDMYIIDKNHLSFWLRRMHDGKTLIAPVRTASGEIVLTELHRMHEAALDGPALMPSPKEFLLPQMEQLFCWSEDGLEESLDKRRRMVFGIRPCDMAAVKILDRFYLDGGIDPYYAARRRNTLFITIACTQPDPTCFCLGLGTGPFLKEGFDIQLTDLGDRFAIEAGSEAGNEIIKAFPHIFKQPGQIDREDIYEARLASQSRFERHVNLEQAARQILSGRLTDEFWESVALRCFECGGCVYNCPVCTCYSIIDRAHSSDSGRRMRIWDTCMLKGFTRMAGGALPAEKKPYRTKRWFHHKLIHWPEKYGLFGCVGCGRCAVSCPGGIDMAAVVQMMKVSNQTE